MPYVSWRVPSVACAAGGPPVTWPPLGADVVPVPPVPALAAPAAQSSPAGAITAVATSVRRGAITASLRPAPRSGGSLQPNVHAPARWSPAVDASQTPDLRAYGVS